MIKKALEYIVEQSKPTIIEEHGEVWTDRNLNRISFEPTANTLYLNTLSSLVDYLKSNFDNHGKQLILINSPTCVSMVSELNHDRKREELVEVHAKVPEFAFGRFMNHEQFCIGLQAKFIPSEGRSNLLRCAGTVEVGSVATYGDDGISQKATVKTGIASKGDVIVPNPVKLFPYRTFIEVEQPGSEFVFRMQGENRIECALFEADGGAWEIEAMLNIKKYLENQLEGVPNLTIIC